MISQFVGKNHRRWDEHLPAIQYAYNSADHDATGFSPAYLNYGRELSPPHPTDRERPHEATPPSRWSRRLADAKELVRVNLARAFHRQEKYYNLRRRDWRPKMGDTVWKRELTLSNKATGINTKLAPKYGGPYTIRRIITPVIFDLRNARNRWYRHIHIQHLKPGTGEETLDAQNREEARESRSYKKARSAAIKHESKNVSQYPRRTRRDPRRRPGQRTAADSGAITASAKESAAGRHSDTEIRPATATEAMGLGNATAAAASTTSEPPPAGCLHSESDVRVAANHRTGRPHRGRVTSDRRPEYGPADIHGLHHHHDRHGASRQPRSTTRRRRIQPQSKPRPPQSLTTADQRGIRAG